MMKLEEIIGDAQFQVRKTIVVLNLTDAPVTTGDAALAKLYDLVLEVAPEIGGDVLKQADRSVFVAFDLERATEAINCAIRLHTHAREHGLRFGAAIASGALTWFETPERGTDYLGAPLGHATSLSRAANARAIFVDAATAQAAALARLEIPSDAGGERLSEAQTIRLSERAEPITYHELLWGNEAFGVRASFISALQEQNPTKDVNPAAWHKGVISRIGPKFGFISDDAGELYYFQSRNLAVTAALKRGARVLFHALPPLRNTKEKRAEDVFVMDATAEGRLTRIGPKGWGFVKLECQSNLEHNLFALGITGEHWTVGQRVRCRIGANDRGPVGLQPELIADKDRPEVKRSKPSKITAEAVA